MTKIIWPALSVLVAAGIFFLSSQSGEISGAASMSIVEWVRGLVPFSDETNAAMNFFLRKGAHFVVFFVLAFCVAQSLKFYISKWKLLLSAWVIASAYGVMDEIHQYFVPGRALEFTDMLINSAGAFAGAGLVLLIVKFSEK